MASVRFVTVLLALIFSGCASIGGSESEPGPSTFTFALIGDLAYVPEQEPAMDNVLSDISAAPLEFVVHVGDLAHPRFGSCTNELWARRFVQFQRVAHPLIYTPGDNDWTDCHEGEGAKGFDPFERLQSLRKLFFQGRQSLGRRTITLTRQSESSDPALQKYRENVRWTRGGVTFLTVHVVGSNNGLGRTAEGDAEYAERTRANLQWLREGFEYAKANRSRAVMVLQQANFFFDATPTATPHDMQPSGFAEIRAALEAETIAFGKPVVLVHGDTHYFRIDKPFGSTPDGRTPALENFTRVETFGVPNHHWLQVTVEPDDPNVFTFRERIVDANLVRNRQPTAVK
ncbi:MAG: metallophosphoesterase [Burkholderiales bacterium]